MSNQIDLSKVQFPDQMDLRTAAIYLGLSEMRVRTLAREESLKAHKDDAGTWVFKRADLDAFKTAPRVRKAGGPRGEGKLWIIRVKHTDFEAVKTFLASKGIELQPRYDYAKQAEYKAKKAKAKAAPAAKPATPATPAK